MRKYKCLLIDADDTILDFRMAERNAIRQTLAEVGIASADGPDVYSRLNHQCWADFREKKITIDELKTRRFAELLAHYGVTAFDAKQAGAHYEHALSRQSIPLGGAIDVVRRISEKMPVAIVTNGTAAVQHGRLDHSEFRPYVSAWVISEEVGFAKPDKEMIELALRALSAARNEKFLPEDALMVGDDLHSDIQCAVNAGCDACWYNPHKAQKPENAPKVTYEIQELEQLIELL